MKFLVGCIVGATLATSVATASDTGVASFEMALGFVPGKTTRVIPALGATVRYLRTLRVSQKVFAVYIEKMD